MLDLNKCLNYACQLFYYAKEELMLGNKVVILGGAGFVGQAVANALSKQGYETKVAVRRPQRHRDFAMFPKTKVVELADYQDQTALAGLFADADVVINLLCDLTSGAEAVTVDGLCDAVSSIQSALEASSVKRVLSLSQVGADATQNHNWLRTLGEADQIIKQLSQAQVTLFKAGLLIGQGDETTSRYAAQLNRMPFLCPVPNGQFEVQPLAITDFAQALVNSIPNANTFGQSLELVGEERLTLLDLAKLVAELQGNEGAILFGMCSLNAKIMAKLGGLAPIMTTSKVQLQTLTESMISNSDFDTQFGFVPKSLEHTLSEYIVPSDMRSRYAYYRQEAGRQASELK